MNDVQKSQLVIDILKRLARELDECAALLDDLHALIERSSRMDVARNNDFVRSAQSIDILEQRLAGLSHFLSELAELTPSHWVVESHAAAKKLKLSKLAEALSYISPDLNSESRFITRKPLILRVWSRIFAKMWCHVCLLFRLLFGLRI